MPVARAPRVLVLIILCFTLIAGLAPAAVAAAGPSILLPAKMAAVGDSITQAASSAGSLGTDAPQNSWSTGTSSTVNSHFLRLRALAPAVTASNLSVSGAKMANMNGQMTNVVAVKPDYLTVLIGGNDLCTDTVAQMTSVDDFRAQFVTAMNTLTNGSPNTNVLVVSIPEVYQLWNLFNGNGWARFIWSVGGVCQSLLANPTSTQPADAQRRQMVSERNVAYNAVLAEVCGAYPTRCLFDGNAAFAYQFATSDVSGDYFHPSVAGQAKLASVSWNAGYSWVVPNRAPTASFTHLCSGLTCTFDDTSTDAGGFIATRAWSFGGSTDPQLHTFAAGGTYSVSLTVTDNELAPATVTQLVTVAPKMRIADLAGSRQAVNSSTWRALVTIKVTNTAGALVSNATVSGGWTVGASDTCITTSTGTCTVTSDDLSRRNTRSVTFTVTGVTHATLLYDASANVKTSVVIKRP